MFNWPLHDTAIATANKLTTLIVCLFTEDGDIWETSGKIICYLDTNGKTIFHNC